MQQSLLGLPLKQSNMASTKVDATLALTLRLLTIVFLLISIIIITTDSLTLPDSTSRSGKTKITFKDVYAYRYVVSVAVIAIAYTLLQIPLAAYHLSKGKQLAGDAVSKLFLFTDMVFSLLLASGVGAGFGITVDLKRVVDEIADLAQDLADYDISNNSEFSDVVSKVDKSLDRVYISTSFLLVATASMGLLTLILFHTYAKK